LKYGDEVKVYISGGNIYDKKSPQLDEFNLHSATISNKKNTEMKYARSWHSSTIVADSKLVVFGDYHERLPIEMLDTKAARLAW